jgi:hypothetical protein
MMAKELRRQGSKCSTVTAATEHRAENAGGCTPDTEPPMQEKEPEDGDRWRKEQAQGENTQTCTAPSYLKEQMSLIRPAI